MEITLKEDLTLDRRIAERLKSLRSERDWSLDELARRSGISRATLSRLENADVSPTANVLGRLCAAYGLTLSRLMQLVEGGFAPRLTPDEQPVWSDPETGFRRRQVSPPAETLAGEVLECELRPGTRIDYEKPPRPGLEHHLVMIEGRLAISVEDATHDLKPGDCLRYRLFGASSFTTPNDSGAKYLLFIV